MIAVREIEAVKWIGTNSPAKHVSLSVGPIVERSYPFDEGKYSSPKWSVGAILPTAADATHVAIYATEGSGPAIYASLEPGANDGIREDSGFRRPEAVPQEKSEAELLADLLESVAADIRKLLAMKAST